MNIFSKCQKLFRLSLPFCSRYRFLAQTQIPSCLEELPVVLLFAGNP